jgi:transcriptional regulator EpsA
MENSEDRDRLIEVLKSATKVVSPSQFFAWTQGPLQALLPHEIIICGTSEGHDQNLHMRFFSATRYFKTEHFEAACNRQTGFIPRVVQHWKSTREPCLVPPPWKETPCDPEWGDLLHRLELRNMAAHGQLSPQGNLNAWFGFFRVRDLGHHTGVLLELIIPCVTATYARMLNFEASAINHPTSVVNILSRREMQVIELIRDGYTNQEIAARLGISVMTAKNHVQSIRTKLKVKTRGQAVIESIHMGIIRSSRDSQ